MTVYDANGQAVDLLAASMLMDDYLREKIAHSYGMECVRVAFGEDKGLIANVFFTLYSEAHERKFGEPFAPYAGLAW